MKFAFVADVPWWALHREGLGLAKYGAVDGHSWDLFHCNPFDCTRAQLESYDAVRLGAASNVHWMALHGMLPSRPKLIVSLSSFWDIEKADGIVLSLLHKHANAFAVVDPRLVAHCARFGKPVLVFSDRCDSEFFYPEPALRPTTGPLRVGWAGSQAYWPGVKHRDWIEQACVALGLTFVRQDRELDGVKDEHAMCAWYAGLDVYCVANVLETPTPVPWIEAAACGVQVVGTRCGELWPYLEAHCPAAVVSEVSPAGVQDALARAAGLGRAKLHASGLDFRVEHRERLYWHLSTAQQHTREVAALWQQT